ncbi:DUF1292 domain-containing protein [Clostridium algidicarnis]|nr:DUF1292 domain-containing protein [Clostridium algidicarnis]MBB6630417.1 DUF1292 domain-containing protein [Clostridium algidicarnis]MBB6696443.1 DUF1292 domain-containing protein [Clostridium algidicarnis]MCB2286577.1 DUF1292 domain-containing protein [Clostridium algidicarnis]
MNNEEQEKCGCGCGENNEEQSGCGCGCGDNNEKQEGCGCGSEDHGHNHDHEGCGCGCGENEFESFVVDLEDEDGNVTPCEVVDGFEYKEGQYVLVQNPTDGSVYLFKSVGEDGELVIPEDTEFEEVSRYYETILEEEDQEEEE